MKHKYTKGEFKYLSQKKKTELLRTILFFGLSIAIFIMGYLSTKTTANYLTIVAVLGCLPASKSAVSMIMNLKVKGCSEKVFDIISHKFGENTGAYHLYFTSYSNNYDIAHIFVKGMTIIAFTENPKIDEKLFEEHILERLLYDSIKGVNVKLYKNLDKYVQRVEQMMQLENEKNLEEKIMKTLFAVSL